MTNFEYWRLCDQLTLIQAALLIAGFDPASCEKEVESLEASEQPDGYAACRQALIGAVNTKELDGYLHYADGSDINGYDYRNLVAEDSWIATKGIPGWLASKGMISGFFFSSEEEPKEYLDPTHERYAPKLAAAIRAWEAAGTDPSLKGTPKQRVEKWMRLNAADYGLVQKDGKPNESAIKAISKISNWQPQGGAPATPAGEETERRKLVNQSGNVVRLKKVSKRHVQQDIDDDIPF